MIIVINIKFRAVRKWKSGGGNPRKNIEANRGGITGESYREGAYQTYAIDILEA
jgi:hypothetical protein